MKKAIFIFILNLFTQTFVCQPLSQEIMDFGTNPGNLSLFYYAPKNAQPGKPLVVVMHGCSHGANAVAELTGWNQLADKYGFYVAYPQQHFPNNPSHCFNWFKNNEIERGKGECESIRQMVEFMIKKFQLNKDSVFVTGLSAGAAMSVVMIATQPGMFKVAAIFAGAPYKPGNNIFSSSGSMVWGVNKTPDEWKELVWRENPAFKGKYPKTIVFHGTADPVVNIKNAHETIEQWTALHKTDTIPDRIDSAFIGKRDIERLAYLNTTDEEVVVFYRIHKMGHAIPVDPGSCNNQGGKSGLFGTIKNFYGTFYAACEFGLVPDWEIQGPPIVKANSENIELKVSSNTGSVYKWEITGNGILKENKNSNIITVSFKNSDCKVSVLEKGADGCLYKRKPLYIKVK